MEGTTITNIFLQELNQQNIFHRHILTFFPKNIENSTALRAPPQKHNHCQIIQFKKNLLRMKWMRTNLKIGYDLNQFSRLTPAILPQTIVSPLIQVYIQHKQQSTIIKLADCLDIHPLQWNGDIIPYGTTNTIKRNLPFEARYSHICNVSQQMIVDLCICLFFSPKSYQSNTQKK